MSVSSIINDNKYDKLDGYIFKQIYNDCIESGYGYYEYNIIILELLKYYTKRNILRWKYKERKNKFLKKSKFLFYEYVYNYEYDERVLISDKIKLSENYNMEYSFEICIPKSKNFDEHIKFKYFYNNDIYKNKLFKIYQNEYYSGEYKNNILCDFSSYSYFQVINYFDELMEYRDKWNNINEINETNKKLLTDFFK